MLGFNGTETGVKNSLKINSPTGLLKMAKIKLTN